MAELNVSGMTCNHCVHAVTSELEAIDGVSGVVVDLNSNGPSKVTFDRGPAVTDEAIAEAIDEAGYELA